MTPNPPARPAAAASRADRHVLPAPERRTHPPRVRTPRTEAELAALTLEQRASLDPYQVRLCIVHLARVGDFVSWVDAYHRPAGFGNVEARLRSVTGEPRLVAKGVALGPEDLALPRPGAPWFLCPGDAVEASLPAGGQLARVQGVKGGRQHPVYFIDARANPALEGEWCPAQLRLPAADVQEVPQTIVHPGGRSVVVVSGLRKEVRS